MATEVAFAKTFLAILDTKPTKISADHVEDPRTYPASTPFILPHHPSLRPFRKPSSRPAPAPGSTPASAASTGTSTSTTPGAATPSSGDAAAAAVVVHIRSARNPTLSLSLPTPQPLATTSILDIKTFVSQETGMPVEKLKVLFNKKPVGDVKSLKEVLSGSVPEGGGELELSLMVMGGQATFDSAEAKAAREARLAAKADVNASETKVEVSESPEVEMKDATQESKEAAAGPVAQGLSGPAVLETEEFWEDLKGYLQQRIRDEKTAEEVVGRFRGAWSGK
ncbi:cell-cycle control medial ring component [Neurospora hispaniola]|uniref:Cell-cycle control medial ring component n=1 Tax=Neurospora hispaniola TaxID=588809 RepID=A0AAJ0MQP3_9PEZI|nr:cell-cycle control medial ring component [Neurospora hispaniola]